MLRLNLHGTVVPSMRFGEAMGRQRSGVILNISSMAATRAISGVLGYSIAKAGIDIFTRWLAVDGLDIEDGVGAIEHGSAR